LTLISYRCGSGSKLTCRNWSVVNAILFCRGNQHLSNDEDFDPPIQSKRNPYLDNNSIQQILLFYLTSNRRFRRILPNPLNKLLKLRHPFRLCAFCESLLYSIFPPLSGKCLKGFILFVKKVSISNSSPKMYTEVRTKDTLRLKRQPSTHATTF
jgi:hypothetical protein